MPIVSLGRGQKETGSSIQITEIKFFSLPWQQVYKDPINRHDKAWEETPVKNENTLDRLCFLAGIGTPWDSPGGEGQVLRRGLGLMWCSLLRLLQPRPHSRSSRENGWMGKT